VRAEPAAVTEATAATGPQPKGPRWLLPAGALLLAAVLAAYLADLVTHLSYMAAMRDLVVYRDGGLIVRHLPPAYNGHRSSPLYDWTGRSGVQFTYPPFAAVIFAIGSVLSWTVMVSFGYNTAAMAQRYFSVADERVCGEWWRGGRDPHRVRDYFQVEVADGGRYWLFRAGDGVHSMAGPGDWFIHGAFA